MNESLVSGWMFVSLRIAVSPQPYCGSGETRSPGYGHGSGSVRPVIQPSTSRRPAPGSADSAAVSSLGRNALPFPVSVTGPWYSLDYTFVIEAGASRLPRAPITAKAEGERPQLARLARA